MPFKDRTNLPIRKSTRKILLKRKLHFSAKIGKALSWDNFLLEVTRNLK